MWPRPLALPLALPSFPSPSLSALPACLPCSTGRTGPSPDRQVVKQLQHHRQQQPPAALPSHHPMIIIIIIVIMTTISSSSSIITTVLACPAYLHSFSLS